MRACPKCSHSLHLLDGVSDAFGCAQCGGLWARPEALSHIPKMDPPASSVRAKADVRTGLCPDGHGILIRARVVESSTSAFYLERCGACHGVWFDAGEWECIASNELRSHLDDLWDPAARRKALALRNEQIIEADLRTRLGEPLHDKLVEVVRLLKDHPDCAMALAFVDTHLR